MTDYIKIKLVAWTAEIEQLKAEIIISDRINDQDSIVDASNRLGDINSEILALLGEDKN